MRSYIAMVLLLLAAPLAAGAQPATFAPLVKAQRGKVVHINTRTDAVPDAGEELLSPLPPPIPAQGAGTGILISADGYVVTNFHVISGARDIAVTLENGRKYRGDVVGMDSHTDLALVKIPASGLPAVEFGDSDRAEVGDWVIAMGSPLGLNYTVTAGIISAKGRNIFGMDNLAYGEFLQTDAAINPGSSGGPLFNLKGQVIGVNSAISRRGQGIGFAVPSNLVVEIVRQLREHGRVIRGWLGVVIQDLTPEMSESLGLPGLAPGVLVEDAQPEGPAARAGLRKGDVVTEFRNERLARVTQLQKLVALSKPGTVVPLRGLRRAAGESEWKPFAAAVTVANDPSQTGTDRQPAILYRLGLELAPVHEVLREQLGLAAGAGALVERVQPGGAAQDVGLQAGDVLLEINRQGVHGPGDAVRILEQGGETRQPMLVRRGSQTLYLVIAVPR
jgi:serine protease Do